MPAGADPDAVLVKDGFNWPAFLLPWLWLIVRRQWLGLLAYMLAAIAIGVAEALPWLGSSGSFLLGLGLNLLAGSLANDWRRWRLEARCYRFLGVVSGTDLADAEARLFTAPWFAEAVRGQRPSLDVATPLWPSYGAGYGGGRSP